VRGGLDVSPVLGSRSTDTLSGIGPPLPAAGDRFSVGGVGVEPIVVDVAPPRPLAHEARISAGPRADWFVAEALDEMSSTSWTITMASRVGVRLRGVALRRVVADELPSEGLVRGAIQVPPDGDPVMMLADHPTTGGYPVIAVVHPDDVAIVAQHHEGTRVRFRV
jgi:allophanate hydrolase subunit 2